jgi:hypothetical protein
LANVNLLTALLDKGDVEPAAVQSLSGIYNGETGGPFPGFSPIIERCIRRFEPRFKSVRVELVDDGSMDRVIRFRIDAKLYTEPVPETVVFDTALEPTTAEFEVRRAER